LLRNYGELKAFEPAYGVNGALTHCYFEFESANATEECLSKMHNTKLGMKTLSVKRAVMAK
jgi:hypothetical protein